MAHVPCEPHAERAAEECQRAERRRSDAIVIFRELITSAQIKSSIYAPDIGFMQLCRAISGPIGQKNDIFCHSRPPFSRLCSFDETSNLFKAELSRTNPNPNPIVFPLIACRPTL